MVNVLSRVRCLFETEGTIALSSAWFRRYCSSMALTTRHTLNKSLQSAFPRGTPFHHQELTKLGVSSALAHHYLKSGWLVRLGRGVFMFPNDTLRRDDCLKFLSRRVKGFHVGGKTALAWRGVRHNLPAREPLSLWGDSTDKIDAADLRALMVSARTVPCLDGSWHA